MPEIASRGNTAYVCECGKKWIFDKTTAAAIHILDAQFPWLRGVEKRFRTGLPGGLQP